MHLCSDKDKLPAMIACFRDLSSQEAQMQVHGQPGGINRFVKKSAVCAQLMRATGGFAAAYNERLFHNVC